MFIRVFHLSRNSRQFIILKIKLNFGNIQIVSCYQLMLKILCVPSTDDCIQEHFSLNITTLQAVKFNRIEEAYMLLLYVYIYHVMHQKIYFLKMISISTCIIMHYSTKTLSKNFCLENIVNVPVTIQFKFVSVSCFKCTVYEMDEHFYIVSVLDKLNYEVLRS